MNTQTTVHRFTQAWHEITVTCDQHHLFYAPTRSSNHKVAHDGGVDGLLLGTAGGLNDPPQLHVDSGNRRKSSVLLSRPTAACGVIPSLTKNSGARLLFGEFADDVRQGRPVDLDCLTTLLADLDQQCLDQEPSINQHNCSASTHARPHELRWINPSSRRVLTLVRKRVVSGQAKHTGGAQRSRD